jgi:hypothetical protein
MMDLVVRLVQDSGGDAERCGEFWISSIHYDLDLWVRLDSYPDKQHCVSPMAGAVAVIHVGG